MRTIFTRRLSSRIGLKLIIIMASVGGVVWSIQRQIRSPDIAAAERGRRIADRMGCFGCHGSGGSGGVFNPGADIGEVPGWTGMTLMMYVQNESEIREWILDGAPKRLRQNDDYVANREKALIHMPAYRERLSGEDLENLIAYLKAVSWFDDPPSDLIATGRNIALQNGCFGCHGPSGQGLIVNPGSFKGHIPGWDSGDFRELVRNDDELEEWILDGISRRFNDNPGARFFLDRQVIKMPAYRDRLGNDELRALKAYVNWIQALPDAPP